jgi:hypothetical protein
MPNDSPLSDPKSVEPSQASPATSLRLQELQLHLFCACRMRTESLDLLGKARLLNWVELVVPLFQQVRELAQEDGTLATPPEMPEQVLDIEAARCAVATVQQWLDDSFPELRKQWEEWQWEQPELQSEEEENDCVDPELAQWLGIDPEGKSGLEVIAEVFASEYGWSFDQWRRLPQEQIQKFIRRAVRRRAEQGCVPPPRPAPALPELPEEQKRRKRLQALAGWLESPPAQELQRKMEGEPASAWDYMRKVIVRARYEINQACFQEGDARFQGTILYLWECWRNCFDDDPPPDCPVVTTYREAANAIDLLHRHMKAVDETHAGLIAQVRKEIEAVRALNHQAQAPAPATAADGCPLPPARHSADFRSIHWFGTDYVFTVAQAAVVALLWQEWENGTPVVGHRYLLDGAKLSNDRLADVFKEKGRYHPAWGSLIQSGVGSKGSARLCPPKTPDP